MFSSSMFHGIKNRRTANNMFYTPRAVSKMAIDFIEVRADEVWLDPWKGGGGFYDQYPTQRREFCEISEGINFLEYNGKPDVMLKHLAVL